MLAPSIPRRLLSAAAAAVAVWAIAPASSLAVKNSGGDDGTLQVGPSATGAA